MMEKIPVPLTREEQAALEEQAKAQRVPLETLLRKAVLEIIIAAQQPPERRQLSAEEFDRALEELADAIPASVPPLSDEALSRESIYTREDEW